MARARRKKSSLRVSQTPLALLLVKFILIKLGSLPFLIVNRSLLIVKWFFSTLFKLRFPKFQLPIKHRRGRPSTTPLFTRYKRKLTKQLAVFFPKPIRVALILGVTILTLFSYTSFILFAAYQLPNPERLVTPTQPLTTEFYDRNGTLLYRMYEGVNRTLVKLDEIPPHLIQATIAIEDKKFYDHMGVDLLAIARAAHSNYQNKTMEGASTLTQQLVKNSLLTPEKTYSRKIKEVILALWAEKIYSKDQIMQMYFNEISYGGPNAGISAATQTYFGKGVQSLNLAEAAYLAGLPASPTQFSPYGSNPELGKLRQKEVLRRMVEDGYITKDQAERAEKEELKIKPLSADIKAPHFVMYVKDLLSQKYGPRAVSQGGLKIYTSLDLGLQEEVDAIVKEEVSNLGNLNVRNGAAMVVDAKTGQILAMAGSHDYYDLNGGQYNVTLAHRQPGSSVKPFTYSAAFKMGFSPGNTILDTPVVFKDEWGNSYAPVNYDGKFHGPVSIRTALASSYNIPAVKTAATVGVDKVIQQARDLGITTWGDTKNYGLSITLGAADVRMIDMMAAYGTFSQMGVKKVPTGILKVVDSNNNLIEEYKDQSSQVLAPQIAYLITHILSDNKARESAFGPNSLLKIEGQVVAVKTGTADWKTDNSIYGYTEDFVVGAWVGNNDRTPMNQALASGVTGATPIWNKIMKGILAKHPSTGFNRPDGVIEVTVDGRKDLAISESLSKSLVRVKKDQEKTTYFDTFSAYATSSAQAAVLP